MSCVTTDNLHTQSGAADVANKLELFLNEHGDTVKSTPHCIHRLYHGYRKAVDDFERVRPRDTGRRLEQISAGVGCAADTTPTE